MRKLAILLLFLLPALTSAYINTASNTSTHATNYMASKPAAKQFFASMNPQLPESAWFIGATGALMHFNWHEKTTTDVSGYRIVSPNTRIDSNNNIQNSAGVIGAQLGYRLNSHLETFLSYQYIAEHSYTLNEFQPGGVPSYMAETTGKLQSQVILANLNYLFQTDRSTVVPFVGVGVGVAINQFGGGQQQVTDISNRTFTAEVAGNTQNQFAAEGRVGLRVPLSEMLQANLFYAATYVGQYKSGDTRVVNGGLPTDPTSIKPYRISDVVYSQIGVALLIFI
jgi:hypothetical protein